MNSGQQKGIVRFKGKTKFKEGEWFGIELDSPHGKNDGSVQGNRYFTCKMKHGVFCQQNHIIKFDDTQKYKKIEKQNWINQPNRESSNPDKSGVGDTDEKRE